MTEGGPVFILEGEPCQQCCIFPRQTRFKRTVRSARRRWTLTRLTRNAFMEQETIRLLLVEDVSKFARVIEGMLTGTSRVKFEVTWVPNLAEGLERLTHGGTDIVLLDLSLAGCEGLAGFDKVRARAPHVPIIVLSSLDDEALALRAVNRGAQDHLVKGQIDSPLLARSIRYSIERHRAEEALYRAEEKYRSIFENTVEGIFQTTANGDYLSANSALARIYGYADSEELIRNLTDVGSRLYVNPGRRADFVRLMDQNDVVTDFESEVRRRDGTVIWISENVRAVRGADHRLLFYEGTVQDITARKRAEQQIRDSEALYHSLVENLPQNILRKDLQERFTFANHRFCATLGRPLEEILGRTDFDFFPAELATKYQQDDRRVMETGEPFETVEEYQPPYGEKLYVNVVKSPVHDADGNIIGLQGIFWDITEKRRAEEAARKANLELARSREELRLKNEQMEEDLHMAREIQQAIIPQSYPCFPKPGDPEKNALEFCHRYIPSGAVGGDFFNVLALSNTKAGVFVCDVMGHGVQSALVTAIVRALVEELTPLAMDPGQLLSQLNRDLRIILRESRTPLFTTAFYLVVDLESRVVRYANAGHPKPLVLRRSTNEVHLLNNFGKKSNPALGLFDATTYPSAEMTMGPEDVFLLFTDGLYDVSGPNEDAYDPDWLLGAVQKRLHLPVEVIFDELVAEVKGASENGALADDVCLVGMEVKL